MCSTRPFLIPELLGKFFDIEMFIWSLQNQSEIFGRRSNGGLGGKNLSEIFGHRKNEG